MVLSRDARLKEVKSSRNRLSIERRELSLVGEREYDSRLKRGEVSYTASTELAYTESRVSISEMVFARLTTYI